jgi:hypothetical protein
VSDYRVGQWIEFIGIPEPDDGTTRYYKGKIVAIEAKPVSGDITTLTLTLEQWPNTGPGWTTTQDA